MRKLLSKKYWEKMINKPEHIQNHIFNGKERLFFDACVWIYIHHPNYIGDWKARKYSSLLKLLKMLKCPIYVDILIISEFINRYAHIEYDRLPPTSKPANFKIFRSSPSFVNIAQDITSDVKKVIALATKCKLEFTTINVDSLLTQYPLSKYDFNDILIYEICKRKSLTMVTHDLDFKGFDIPILTANPKLIT